MTHTSAPTPARLNILQLLELAKTIVCEISPRVSARIGDLMLELVGTTDDDEALLRDRVAISVLEGRRVDDLKKERGSDTCHVV